MLRPFLAVALLTLGSLAIMAPPVSADCVATFRSDTQSTAVTQARDPRDRSYTNDYLRRQAGDEGSETIPEAVQSGPNDAQDHENSLVWCSSTDYMWGACPNYVVAGVYLLGNPLSYSPYTAVAAVHETRSCVTN